MRSDFAGFLFDAPGAGAGSIQGTVPFSINPAGEIAGNYSDPSNVNHGFLLAGDGTISKFDAPGEPRLGPGCLPC